MLVKEHTRGSTWATNCFPFYWTAGCSSTGKCLTSTYKHDLRKQLLTSCLVSASSSGTCFLVQLFDSPGTETAQWSELPVLTHIRLHRNEPHFTYRAERTRRKHSLLWLRSAPFWTSPAAWWAGRRRSEPGEVNKEQLLPRCTSERNTHTHTHSVPTCKDTTHSLTQHICT